MKHIRKIKIIVLFRLRMKCKAFLLGILPKLGPIRMYCKLYLDIWLIELHINFAKETVIIIIYNTNGYIDVRFNTFVS